METPEVAKARRGVLKGQLTKAMTALNRLMMDEDNAQDVHSKSKELENLLSKFEEVCDTHKAFLTESPAELQKAEVYRKTVTEEITGFHRHVVSWLATVEECLSDDEDEIEQLRKEFESMRNQRTPVKTFTILNCGR